MCFAGLSALHAALRPNTATQKHLMSSTTSAPVNAAGAPQDAIVAKLQKQLDYYFSDANLRRDAHLRGLAVGDNHRNRDDGSDDSKRRRDAADGARRAARTRVRHNEWRNPLHDGLLSGFPF